MAQPEKNPRSRFVIDIFWLGTGVVDYLNTSSIYSNYVTPALMQAFKQSLQFIFFPIYAIDTAIFAILALINLFIDKDDHDKIKKVNVVRLIVSMISALVVGTAVIGCLAFAAAMGMTTTFLFGFNLALTGIYNFVGAGYHFYQASKLVGEEAKKQRKTAIAHLAIGITIAMAALAGSLAIFGGFLPLAGIGIAAGVIGIAFCIYGLVETIREKAKNPENKDKPPQPVSESTLDGTWGMFKRLRLCISSFCIQEEDADKKILTSIGSEQLPEQIPLLNNVETKLLSPNP